MQWKTSLSYPSYEVSEFGDVRRIAKGIRGGQVGKVMKPYRRTDGYNMFILRRGNESFHAKAHQLVAEAYICPKPFHDAEVCHNDGTRDNDHFSNLRWGTCAENHGDKILHGTAQRGENHGGAKLSAAHVAEIKARYAQGGIFQRELGEEYGVKQGHISRILNGVRRAHD